MTNAEFIRNQWQDLAVIGASPEQQFADCMNTAAHLKGWQLSDGNDHTWYFPDLSILFINPKKCEVIQ